MEYRGDFLHVKTFVRNRDCLCKIVIQEDRCIEKILLLFSFFPLQSFIHFVVQLMKMQKKTWNSISRHTKTNDQKTQFHILDIFTCFDNKLGSDAQLDLLKLKISVYQ